MTDLLGGYARMLLIRRFEDAMRALHDLDD